MTWSWGGVQARSMFSTSIEDHFAKFCGIHKAHSLTIRFLFGYLRVKRRVKALNHLLWIPTCRAGFASYIAE